MKYNTVIFDLDGTLVNTIGGIAKAVNIILQKYDFPTKSIEEYMALVGYGRQSLVRNCIPEDSFTDKLFEVILSEVAEQYRECLHEMYVYDGVRDILDFLEINEIPFSLNTNREEDTAIAILDTELPEYNFKSIVAYDTTKTKKPDAGGVFHILHRLGFSPHECVYIGDSEVDIQTANNAGMYCIAVSWGYRSRDFLLENGATAVVDSVEDIIEILQG